MPQQSFPSPLDSDYPRYSLPELADRLSSLAVSQTGVLATELQVAALCCRDAHTRWEDLVQSLKDYREERSQLTAWFDDQVEQLQEEALGLVVPAGPEDLSHLRPDAEGRYAWDRWESQARAAGLAEDLAGLGRAVMREAVQHDWEPLLKLECGWGDAGQTMLDRALRDGPTVSARWQQLLDTDGERGYWTPDGAWHTGTAPA